MLVLRLALRALSWRAAVSATVFGVALIGVLAAAIGPIYLRAVDETVLAERLVEAPQAARDINISRVTITGSPGADWIGSIRDLGVQAADPRWFAPPVNSEIAQVTYKNRITYATRLASIDDLCAHLHVVKGRCVTAEGTGETVITSRTANSQHIALGDVVKVSPAGETRTLAVKVVGIVEPIAVDGVFWAPWHYFDAAGAVSDQQPPHLDSFFVSRPELSKHLDDVAQTISAEVRLLTNRVHVDDVPTLKDDIDAVVAAASALSGRDGLTNVVVGSQLPTVLDGMNHEMSLARTLILVPTAQLVLLAMFILYAVVAGTTAALGPEVALAKLRGRRPTSILLQSVVQPIVLILLATPVAALLAWLVVRLVADHLLGRHVDVVFPLSAIAVIGAAAAAAVLAALAAARRIVVSPVGALLRRGADSSGSSFGLALADAAAVALAVAGLAQLIAGGVLDSGRTSPLSAVAPVLLAIAVAIGMLRLLPIAGRAAVRWTRDSSRLPSFLAVRQIVRRPAGARVILPVGIALALATFALINWSVAGSNRAARALNDAGAPTVLRVEPGSGVTDLTTAVDRADPSGNSMAVARVQSGHSTPLLAVDTTRFANVAAWRSNYSATPLPQLLEKLREHVPSITFTGTRLRLEVQVAKAPKHTLDLGLDLTNSLHVQLSYPATLTGASGSHVFDLGPDCLQNCRITGLKLAPAGSVRPYAPPGTIRASITAQVEQDGTWRPVAGFDDPKRWRGDDTGLVFVSGAAPALRLTVGQSAEGTPWPGLISSDMPSHLPAVLASGTAALYPGPSAHDATSFGLDNHSQAIDGLYQAVTLPELDRYGVLVDYEAALRQVVAGLSRAAEYEVWLSSDAPPDMPARLAKQGVHVTGTVHAATYRVALDHTGPAFADELFIVAAVASIALAVGAALLAGITTARRRAYEVVSLEASGVSRRSLRGALAVEQAVLLGAGLLVGVGTGLIGSALALPSTPFFVAEDIGPPPDRSLPWGLVGSLVGVLVVVFVITCVVVSWLIGRQATAARFREAQA